MHESSKNFNDRDKQRLECAAAATAATVEVTPSALRIPTGEPLNMFGPVAWTAFFVEFLYGDATPGLQRDREVLYEEWCQCLLSREELQHSMPDDEEQYVASSPSRFVRPEILACMHDGRRRLGMLTGARTYLSRKGFAQDLKLLGRATVDDIIAAQRSVGDASASEAMNRPDLRQSVRVSLKGLLFATANVPGTEGYRVRQRHLGNAMNVLFSPCVLFITLNFADTRSPIVLMLDEGTNPEQYVSALVRGTAKAVSAEAKFKAGSAWVLTMDTKSDIRYISGPMKMVVSLSAPATVAEASAEEEKRLASSLLPKFSVADSVVINTDGMYCDMIGIVKDMSERRPVKDSRDACTMTLVDNSSTSAGKVAAIDITLFQDAKANYDILAEERKPSAKL
eukprot:s403_g5.t2